MDQSRIESYRQRITLTEHGLIWTGVLSAKGYGMFRMLGERLAHRIAWQLAYGPIPTGLCVLHRCDTPPCVTPDHLFLGTRAENSLDMWAKGRQARHLRGPGPKPAQRHRKMGQGLKLEAAEVLAIRAALANGVSPTALAATYSVSTRLIGLIKTRQSWSKLP